MMGDGLEHHFPLIKPKPQDETDSTTYHSIHALRILFAFEC